MDHSFHTRRLYPTVKGFVLTLMLFSFFISKAQDDNKFSLRIKFSVKGGNFDNCQIAITKNGAPLRVIDPEKAKYDLDLDLGSEYVITFTKLGYISKSLAVDTHVPGGREKEDFNQYIATVELNAQPEGQEVTYTQPVGKITYSVPVGQFDADKDYSQKAQDMVQKAEAHPKPKPKTPEPTPPPAPKPVPPPVVTVSNPVPVAVKQPEYKPEPPKPKPVAVIPEAPQKPIVKNKEEKVIQEDRRKITNITVTIDGVDYVYRKEEYSWGGVYYYKDGKNITEGTYNKETE